MPEITNPEYIEFDVVVKNNVGNLVKIRTISIYKDEYNPQNDEKIKERLASEIGYEGLGLYFVYPHTDIKIGDEISVDIEPAHTVDIAVFSTSLYSGKFAAGSTWIPVAAVGQETTLRNGDHIKLSKDSLESNLESWKGGYINVNHVDNGEIEGLKIEDAKFEGDLLYHKVSKRLAEFILNSASSGRSIEINKMVFEDNEDPVKVVTEYNGLGLSVLYPPLTPSCTIDMGCSSSNLTTGFTDSQSFVNNTIETSGTDPNLEQSMTEETDKLKFAKIEAEKSRDEALKEVETLKFSLVEMEKTFKAKDATISDKDTLITEQTDRLKFYAEAEAKAAEKLKGDQWDILKSSIPPGKFHKPEDEAALKKEFLDDPASFAVKMTSWKREDPTGESGAEFTAGASTVSDADISKGISALGIPGITFGDDK